MPVNMLCNMQRILGTDGSVLPNTCEWSEQCIMHPACKTYNVTEVVLKSISSSIEAAMCSKRRDPSFEEVAQTQVLLRSAVAQALKLYDLKQSLLLSNHEHKLHAGVKFHALFHHYGSSVLRFGAPYFLDTAAFENAHIADGMATWNRSSRRRRDQTLEMTKVLGKRRRAEFFESAVEQRSSLDVVRILKLLLHY